MLLILSSPQILRTFMRSGGFSSVVFIVPSQKSFVLLPFNVTKPFLSILSSESLCQVPSLFAQSRLINSINSKPFLLIVIGLNLLGFEFNCDFLLNSSIFFVTGHFQSDLFLRCKGEVMNFRLL